MRKFIIALVLMLTGVAFAATDMVARRDGDEVRMYQDACADETILSRIPEPFRQDFRRAAATISGVQHEACWPKAVSDDEVTAATTRV